MSAATKKTIGEANATLSTTSSGIFVGQSGTPKP